MEKNERFKKAYEYLRNKGVTHTQADLAEKMGATSPNVSRAFSGDSKFLTDRFLLRFNNAFGAIFNEDWLLRGEGEMLRCPITQIGDNNNNQQGNNISYNNATIISKAFDEISEMRKLLAESIQNNKEQADKFFSVIERIKQ